MLRTWAANQTEPHQERLGAFRRIIPQHLLHNKHMGDYFFLFLSDIINAINAPKATIRLNASFTSTGSHLPPGKSPIPRPAEDQQCALPLM